MTDFLKKQQYKIIVNPYTQVWINITSYILVAIGLLMILYLHLLSSLLAGLLVYQLVYNLALVLEHRLSGNRAKIIAIVILAILIVGGLAVFILLTITYFKKNILHTIWLFDRIMEIIDQAREHLPIWANQYLPDDSQDIHNTLLNWLRTHITVLRTAGKKIIIAFMHILIGMVLGAIIAIDVNPIYRKPLSIALVNRIRQISIAFRRIVFAQVKISFVNSIFTALFLLIALPILSVKLPLAKTLVFVTFIVGLLPVIGNLISNSLIIIVTLSVGLQVTLAALIFLVIIHKLEYFLNARIIGGEIEAKAWELLLAMLIMESAFGLVGIIAAPMYYAYIKRELREVNLI